MNGTRITDSGYVSQVSDMNWFINEVGDFNGDGKSDNLWRNSTTGEKYMLWMDGTSIADTGYVNQVSDIN